MEARKKLAQLRKQVADLQAEIATLRARTKRDQTIIETALDFIFLINRQGHLEFVNRAGAALIGRDPEQIVGVPLSELFPEEAEIQEAEILQQVFQTGEPVADTFTLDLGERTVWLNARLVPIRDSSHGGLQLR